MNSYVNAQTIIENLYLTILKRPPKEKELKFYLKKTKINPMRVRKNLLQSDEMKETLNKYCDDLKGLQFTILTLFRDNEEFVDIYKYKFNKFEKIYNKSNFKYFFYENDSKDQTLRKLQNFLKTHNGKLKSETLGLSLEGGKTITRSKNMSLYRNKLLNLARPFTSDWTIITDTNIFIKDYSILGYMVNFAKMHPDAVMIASNGLFLNPKNPYHSYDSYAFKYKGRIYWHCLSKDCLNCPSRTAVYDFKTDYLKVDAVFGGFVIVKSDLLNKINYKEDYDAPECEHIYFCEQLRKYGNIYFLPKATLTWIP